VREELQPGDPERIGPYRVIRPLGSGGMGRVFLGRSAGGRPVAVKVIRADLAADSQFRARFRREVDAARKVNGLYTALVVDADLDGPMPWLATAYVAGPSLAEAVASQGPLPEASVLTLAAGLAEGLAAIHAVGVVHRDLKPANVLLADDGPRVIDFGISRAAEASALTHTGLLVGSPGFMSPEQAEGGEVGSPSDVFSLGAVLVFAATGHGPFGAGPTAALVYRVVHGAPDLDGCPAGCRALIERCLSKEPGQRPAAGDLLAELDDADLAEGWPPVLADREAVRATWERPVTGEVPGIGAEPTVTHPVKPGSGRAPASRSRRRREASRALSLRPVLTATLTQQGSQGVNGVAFSPDGGLLAAADGNGRTYLWDVANGRLAGTLADARSQDVYAVAFGPRGDLLAAADGNGRAYLWDVATGELAGALAGWRSKGVIGVAFSPDGGLLAAADSNGRTYLWDVANGRLAGTLADARSQDVYAVAFGPDGGLLATADGNGRAYVWDVATGRLADALAGSRSKGVIGVAFSPDGGLLAAADGNGRAYLWDVGSGELAGALADPGSRGVNGVAFGPDGGLLAAADCNGCVYLWQLRR